MKNKNIVTIFLTIGALLSTQIITATPNPATVEPVVKSVKIEVTRSVDDVAVTAGQAQTAYTKIRSLLGKAITKSSIDKFIVLNFSNPKGGNFAFSACIATDQTGKEKAFQALVKSLGAIKLGNQKRVSITKNVDCGNSASGTPINLVGKKFTSATQYTAEGSAPTSDFLTIDSATTGSLKFGDIVDEAMYSVTGNQLRVVTQLTNKTRIFTIKDSTHLVDEYGIVWSIQ